MIETIEKKDVFDVTKHRICHLAPLDNDLSYCGLAVFNPTTAHSPEQCKRYHSMCIVCVAEWERTHGELWESWSS